MPDPLGVIPDGAVGGELAHARHIQDRGMGPGVPVAPQGTGTILAVDIGLVIGEHEERVAAIADAVADQPGEAWIGQGDKPARRHGVRDAVAQFWCAMWADPW